jgi:V/A-type H+-transporting ATPase subunit D
MGKIKLTKGELKRQRDALKQYERYLPTLQLKKQQLQIEITRQALLLEEKVREEESKRKAAQAWAGVFSDQAIDAGSLLVLENVLTTKRNIAGVDIEVFGSAEFRAQEYDLFLMPPWVDAALESLKILVSLQTEAAVMRKGITTLSRELRITTQRVNLFEKVKIPEAQEAIRLIKIYIGDQMANAVGRSKIAKRKIEELEFVTA